MEEGRWEDGLKPQSRPGDPQSTDIYFSMRSWFGDVCSCRIYLVLPGIALILLNYVSHSIN